MYWRIKWDKTGDPLGFFILRYDPENEWMITNGNSSIDAYNLMNKYKNSRSTINNSAPTDSFFIPASAATSYTLDDNEAPALLPTHYELIQLSQGKVMSLPEYFDPILEVFDPPDFGASGGGDNSTIDNKIFVENPYCEDLEIEGFDIEYAGVKFGSMELVIGTSEISAKNYGILLTLPDFRKINMLEIKGAEQMEETQIMDLADIGPNILVWT